MPHPPEHKLRWYQYKLSLLFVLMTLVAIACSWYATQMHNAAKRRAAIVEIEKVGWVEYYDASDPFFGGKPPRWFSWLRKLHGDEHLGEAITETQRTLPAPPLLTHHRHRWRFQPGGGTIFTGRCCPQKPNNHQYPHNVSPR